MSGRLSILRLGLRQESDVVLARQRARDISRLLGFDGQEQVRIATAVSEIARNALVYAKGGTVEFAAEPGARPRFVIQVNDQGPGITRLEEIQSGLYRSPTGMGLGILGAQRLMDDFTVDSRPGQGTHVEMAKVLPSTVHLAPPDVGRIADELLRRTPPDPYAELREQNRELLRALEEVRRQREELTQVNAELEETNRGVMALYAELDERAEMARKASEEKSRFLSNMSHEFKTPLGSMSSLLELLLDRVDGPLTSEQEVQLRLVRRSADELTTLVTDLLDLAKLEAGKTTVTVSAFPVGEVFSALRGMLKPLVPGPRVQLLFDEPPADLSPLETDEGKLGQILRNFGSNALKFTTEGTVRVSAERGPGDTIVFSVADTGLGIAREDLERIFEEFSQVEGPHQRKAKGTGLGLPLTRKLAQLLGGTVAVKSIPGQGSVFRAILPRVYVPLADQPVLRRAKAVDDGENQVRRELGRSGHGQTLLIVDDDEAARYVLRQPLERAGFRVEQAAAGYEGLARAEKLRPAVIFLDLRLPDVVGTEVLARLKADEALRQVPVIIYTSQTITPALRAQLADAVAILPKFSGSLGEAIAGLEHALSLAGVLSDVAAAAD